MTHRLQQLSRSVLFVPKDADSVFGVGVTRDAVVVAKAIAFLVTTLGLPLLAIHDYRSVVLGSVIGSWANFGWMRLGQRYKLRIDVGLLPLYLAFVFVTSLAINQAMSYWRAGSFPIFFIPLIYGALCGARWRSLLVSIEIAIYVFATGLLTRGDISVLVVTLLVGVGIAEAMGYILKLKHLADLKVADMMTRLETMASTDSLTGLANRHTFDEISTRLDTGDALILIDIDHFKAINDAHGHSGGDKALCDIADYMRAVIRENDVAARLGGDELVIILWQVDLDEAIAITHRLREYCQRSPLKLTFSAGIAIHDGGETYAQLECRADQALYAAKDNGRNRTQLAVSAA